MPNFENILPSFSNLAVRLFNGGIAPRHVRRTIAELQDHYTDLLEEATKHGLSRPEAEVEALSRLGTEDDLVTEMLSKPELRSWASRWPWLFYGLVPVVTSFAIAVMCVMVVVLGVEIFTDEANLSAQIWLKNLLQGVFFTVVYILPLLIAAIVCRQATMRRDGWVWPLVGLFLLCVIFAALKYRLQWPEVPGERGSFSASFGFMPPYPLSFSTLVRTVLNLGFVAVILYWFRARKVSYC